MKKLSSLLLTAILTVSITSCSQEIINNTPIQPNNASTYSDEGLKSTFNFVLQSLFKMADRNKDSSISLDEYKYMFKPSIPPSEPSEPLEPQPEPPSQNQIIANQIEVEAKKMDIPINVPERFNKIDKNKDGKLSFSEAKNSPAYFSFMTKKQLREYAKLPFDIFDKDKNKAMTRDEFFEVVFSDPQSNKKLQGMLFVFADKNNNGSLSFSEFEDVYYSSLKELFAGTTTNQPSPQPVPVPIEDPAPIPVQP